MKIPDYQYTTENYISKLTLAKKLASTGQLQSKSKELSINIGRVSFNEHFRTNISRLKEEKIIIRSANFRMTYTGSVKQEEQRPIDNELKIAQKARRKRIFRRLEPPRRQ